VDLPIELLPEAVAEAAAARDWYAQRSQNAAAAFLAELDTACERIVEAPKRYPAHVAGTRRYLMRRFPFHVVYRTPPEPDGMIQVIAVAHGHRRPGYWGDRST
jgi:plasmid stabilization system protein ParE